MASVLLAALALAAVQAPAAARVPTPAAPREAGMLAWLQGRWRGTGTMFGRPSEARLEVFPALDGRFLELSWRTAGFEGRAFYRYVGEGRWRATWFDSRGVSFPIEALVTNPRRIHSLEYTLVADWGSAETERGRTTYHLLPDNRLEVIDHAGGRDFASHILARVD